MIKSSKRGMNFGLLVCVYTCKADDHLLEDFYSSRVMQMLRGRSKTKIIEVRADDSLTRDSFSNGQLTVSTSENYSNLPRKTYSMIRYVTDNFRFGHLLKIDITTLTTSIEHQLQTGGKVVTEETVLAFLCDDAFYQDYNGYVQLNAKRKGAQNWAKSKGIVIDYDKVFSGEELPPFFSGKMWLLSYDFAAFISNHGGVTVDNFSKNFPAEDVMIGSLYPKFVEYRASENVLMKWLRAAKYRVLRR